MSAAPFGAPLRFHLRGGFAAMCMIVCVVFGVIALIKGEFSLSGNRVVPPVPARIIGVILLLPLPLSFVAGIILGLMIELRGDRVDLNDKGFQTTATILEVAIMGACFLTAFLVAIVTAKPKRRKRRRLEEDDEEYADDRPRPRRRPRDEDDEGDEPPPPRRPRYEDDDEDRPRQRPDDRYRE